MCLFSGSSSFLLLPQLLQKEQLYSSGHKWRENNNPYKNSSQYWKRMYKHTFKRERMSRKKLSKMFFLNKLTFFSVNKMTQRCVNPRRMSKIFAKERRRDGKPSWESEKRSRMSSQGKEIFYTFFIHSFSKRKLPESEKEMKMNWYLTFHGVGLVIFAYGRGGQILWFACRIKKFFGPSGHTL